MRLSEISLLMKTEKDIYRQKDLKTTVTILAEFLSPFEKSILEITLLEFQQRLTAQITEWLWWANNKSSIIDLNDIKGKGNGRFEKRKKQYER